MSFINTDAIEQSPEFRPPRVSLISLGCAKNTVDSESALGELLEAGFELSPDPEQADLIIVNTCGFIADAREESTGVLRDMLSLKDEEGWPKVIAIGCLPQRAGADLLGEMPELDAVLGLAAYGKLPSICQKVMQLTQGAKEAQKWRIGKQTCTAAPLREGPRLLITPKSYAYLRIAEGCDNRCAYCTIPSIRGGLQSRAQDDIVSEARSLVDCSGVKELVLVAQDTTAYGMDKKNCVRLPALLEALLTQTAAQRIRILYAHPVHIDNELIGLLGREERLCHYIDMPIQHINDSVLRSMRRPYGQERIHNLIEQMHGSSPNFTIRSTVLVGFPGEDDAAFTELLDFVRHGYITHLGAFCYSPEPNTRAYHMGNGVPREEAERRQAAILEVQQTVAFEWQEKRLGTMVDVLVDSIDENHAGTGRSTCEAPEVDPVIRISGEDIYAGGIFRACLGRRVDYDVEATSCPIEGSEGTDK